MLQQKDHQVIILFYRLSTNTQTGNHYKNKYTTYIYNAAALQGWRLTLSSIRHWPWLSSRLTGLNLSLFSSLFICIIVSNKSLARNLLCHIRFYWHLISLPCMICSFADRLRRKIGKIKLWYWSINQLWLVYRKVLSQIVTWFIDSSENPKLERWILKNP